MKAIGRELKEIKESILKTKNTLEIVIQNQCDQTKKEMQEEMKFGIHKELKRMEKSINDTVAVHHHEAKQWTNSSCEQVYTNIKQEYIYYIEKKMAQMRQSFDVDGIVDSSFESSLEARNQGKWKTLAEWLKDNDELNR